MTDLPIIFSPAMVEALLAGRKTMTRRMPWAWLKTGHGAGKLRHFDKATWCAAMKGRSPIRTIPFERPNVAFAWTSDPMPHQVGAIRAQWIAEPVAQPGDRLYVRETHYRFGVWKKDGKTKRGHQRWRFKALGHPLTSIMFLDAPPEPRCIGTRQSKGRPVGQWWKRPSIHMPKALSRLTLIVTAAKIERLCDISAGDAMAEGIAWDGAPLTGANRGMAVALFLHLWSLIHGDDSVGENPEVYAQSFVVHRANIDQVARAA